MIDIKDEARKQANLNLWINLVMNAGIVYWTKRELDALGFWGAEGYAFDMLMTGLILCAILSCIFILMYQKKRDGGELGEAEIDPPFLTRALPVNTYLAVGVMGLCGLVIASSSLALFAWATDFRDLTPVSYAALKGIWAGLLAFYVVPICIYYGARDSA